MISTFAFSISKLGYVAVFLFFFLTHQGKNEDEDKKIWKNEFYFDISISKLGFTKIFMKILEKKF